MAIPKFRIPDRFEIIERLEVNDKLASFIVKVDHGLAVIQEFLDEMETAGRGGLLVLHGPAGVGKSTLLGTVHLFLDGVGRKVFGISPDESIPDALENLPEHPKNERLRIVVIKGREALGNKSRADLETALHAINQFIRTEDGARTLIAWPCTTDDMRLELVTIARGVGGTALLGGRNDAVPYSGPPKEKYVSIAKNMIETLNDGMTLSNLGFSELRAETIAQESPIIGEFLLKLAREAKRNRDTLVNRLPEKDWYQLWVVVVAGNDVSGEIHELTHGAGYSLDIDRLLQTTDGNVAKNLRPYSEKLGMLSAGMEAKLVYVPSATAMAALFDYADASDARDKTFFDEVKIQTKFKGEGESRLKASALARALERKPVTTQQRGPKATATPK
jgi:hypothetical protein